MLRESESGNERSLAQIDEYACSRYGEYFPDAARGRIADRGPVELDYWSISYRLAFPEHSIFIKIPKVEPYQSSISHIARDARARRSAEIEFDGFRRIHGIPDWPAGCSAVRPLEYIPGFNAIATEFHPSRDLFRVCRQAAFPGKLRSPSSAEDAHSSLRRCGRWLRHFQRAGHGGETLTVGSGQLLADIGAWAGEIETLCLRPRFVRQILNTLERHPWSAAFPKSRTSEGFEVRNIIVDRAGTVRLVDPGQLGWSSGLEDVAHFLVSLTMLFWGRPSLWLGIPIARAYRRSFLDAWRAGDASVSAGVLAWFETRELFRQWRDAYQVIARKPYSAAARRLLRAAYIDLFFMNRIRRAAALAGGGQTTERTE